MRCGTCGSGEHIWHPRPEGADDRTVTVEGIPWPVHWWAVPTSPDSVTAEG